MKNWGFHLKNSKWSCPNFDNAIQGQMNDIILQNLNITIL